MRCLRRAKQRLFRLDLPKLPGRGRGESLARGVAGAFMEEASSRRAPG